MYLAIIILLLLNGSKLLSQADLNAYRFSGIVYDDKFKPIPYTHVLARGSGQGDVTDSLGIFTIYIRETDQLSFYNLTCWDTTVLVQKDMTAFHIKLRHRIYFLKEAKIFDWGSSYGEFLEEVHRQGVHEKLGEKLGLPQQDPGVIPFDRDEAKLKSPGFLLTSPVSYFYYNFSKREKSARKAYKLEKDRDKIENFQRTLSPENLASITGLKGKELEEFIIFLNSRLSCTYNCTELQVLTEIHAIWQIYRDQ